MTDINHHRKNKKPVNQRYKQIDYKNGYAHSNNKVKKETLVNVLNEAIQNGYDSVLYKESGSPRVGKTDFLDKSMHGWSRKSMLANKTIGAYIGNDFSNGHRGMAKAVKGAKKYVKTRIRFQENAAVKKLEIFDE
jgi:hypothetical protein